MPRRYWLPSGLCAAIALLLCFVPLFDLLAYEFSFAMGLVAAISATVIGLGVGRSHDGAVAIARAAGLGVLHLVPALAIISANALFVRNCDYGEGLAFFALLPCMTAAYSGAGGALIAQVLRPNLSRYRAGAAAAFILAPLVASLWKLYWQPPIVTYDHLWGHFAGSLYDEVIEIDVRLLVFRTFTVLRIGSMALCAWALAHKRQPRFVALVAVLAFAPLLAAEDALGSRLGFAVDRDDILRELSATEERPGLVIHLPKSLDPERRRAIADDHAFRLEQLQTLFDVRLDQPIHSFVYQDAVQKGRLQGGRGTMIAKPWLFEIHVHDPVAPHPVVAHELAHVVAASFAEGPLRVSSKLGFFVNMGLVEGLAEGVTPERSDLDLFAWSRALLELRLAPDLRRILGPAGFWSEASRRAYTIAGSFVRFLLQTYGPERLKQAYAHGDFESAYGQSLDQLLQAWETYVRSQALAPFELELARDQFKTPSIFQRTCAHEVAALRDAAYRAGPAEAVGYYRAICKHLDDAPGARFDLALAYLRAGEMQAFADLAESLNNDGQLTAVQRSQLLEGRGELAWERGDRELATTHFSAAAALRLGPMAERLQAARLWALGKDPDTSEVLRRFMREKLPPVAAVLELERAWKAQPTDAMYPYLIARQLLRADSCAVALRYLEAARGLSPPIMEAERLRTTADCLTRVGRYHEGRDAWNAYLAVAPTSGERARAQDEIERGRWLEKQAQRTAAQ